MKDRAALLGGQLFFCLLTEILLHDIINEKTIISKETRVSKVVSSMSSKEG